jgi:DNA-binding beta-propeller fold protein YncE
MCTRYTGFTLSFLFVLAFGITAAMPVAAAHAPDSKPSPRPSSQESSVSTETCLTTLFVVDFSGSVYSIQTTTNEVNGMPIEIGEKPGSVVMNPAATTMYVTNNGRGISVIDIASREVTQLIPDAARRDGN